MWHAVTPVTEHYDPILYENPQPANALVFNSGPGIVVARAWPEVRGHPEQSQVSIQLRPGDQRVLGGALIRVRIAREQDLKQLIQPGPPNALWYDVPGRFAAVAWRLL